MNKSYFLHRFFIVSIYTIIAPLIVLWLNNLHNTKIEPSLFITAIIIRFICFFIDKEGFYFLGTTIGIIKEMDFLSMEKTPIPKKNMVSTNVTKVLLLLSNLMIIISLCICNVKLIHCLIGFFAFICCLLSILLVSKLLLRILDSKIVISTLISILLIMYNILLPVIFCYIGIFDTSINIFIFIISIFRVLALLMFLIPLLVLWWLLRLIAATGEDGNGMNAIHSIED